MTTDVIPKKQIELVLRREFIAPFIDSIRQDPVLSLKLSNAFVLLRVSEQIIVELDKKQVEADENVEAVRGKTLFLGYLRKIYQSALLLIGATDYLGAMILLRSVFELLVGVATIENGSMRDRISSIGSLDSGEKDDLQKLWNELSAWAHPYGKWVKNICPKFYGTGRNDHPVTFSQCLTHKVHQNVDTLKDIKKDHQMLTLRFTPPWGCFNPPLAQLALTRA
ncbi:MAG: hypothetical protein JRF50_14735 [Deltaproteobacteria bacterium]|nr:hypothetical protein [Deltaproteobacteria bacterium]